MKTSFSNFLLAGLSALASLGFVSNAQAVLAAPTAPYAVYSFNGVCEDCSSVANSEDRNVTATLTLQPFAPGGSVDSAHFFSFVYDGSSAFAGFTILGSDSGVNVRQTQFPAGAIGGDVGSLSLWVSANVFLGNDENTTPIFFRTYGSDSETNGRFELGFGTGEGSGNEGGGPVETNDFGLAHSWTLTQTASTNVPEPGSLLLMGAALVALGVARRKRS